MIEYLTVNALEAEFSAPHWPAAKMRAKVITGFRTFLIGT